MTNEFKTVEELQDRIMRLEQVIEDANNILFDGLPLDVEHLIQCHPDTVPNQFRHVTSAASKALEVLQTIIQERLK